MTVVLSVNLFVLSTGAAWWLYEKARGGREKCSDCWSKDCWKRPKNYRSGEAAELYGSGKYYQIVQPFPFTPEGNTLCIISLFITGEGWLNKKALWLWTTLAWFGRNWPCRQSCGQTVRHLMYRYSYFHLKTLIMSYSGWF